MRLDLDNAVRLLFGSLMPEVNPVRAPRVCCFCKEPIPSSTWYVMGFEGDHHYACRPGVMVPTDGPSFEIERLRRRVAELETQVLRQSL